MSYIRTRRSYVQARSHATAPRSSDGGLTTAARVESRNMKRCRYRAFSAIVPSARPTRMTQRQWRRSDRAFRSRDLDLHRTLTGRLREPRRGDFEGTVGGYNVDRSASRASYLLYTSIPCTLGCGVGQQRLYSRSQARAKPYTRPTRVGWERG